MALIDALNDIVDEMERDADDPKMRDNFCGQCIRSYAKMIRIAMKAETQPRYEKPNWEKEAREEFRSKKKVSSDRIDVLERFEGGVQVGIVDGPLGGTDFFEIAAGGKPGQKLIIENTFVYRLGEDNMLHYEEEDTQKLMDGKLEKEKSSPGGILLG